MAVSVLIITPTKGFGELIHQALEEAGGYIPALAVTGPEAVELQKSTSPAICVIDVDFAEAPLNQFVQALRSANPQIKIVLIPSDQGKDEEILAALEADAYLSKPFYLPDLLENLERVIHQGGLQSADRLPKTSPKRQPKITKKEKKAEIMPPPEWLQDASLASEYLTRLSLESSSQAVIMIRGEDIWAFAGDLSQPAAKELATSIAMYWDDEGSDLARFVHLDETGGDHMMYATSLGGEYVLALIFDAATPFSKIRSQAGQLARSLAAPLDEQAPAVFIEEESQPPEDEWDLAQSTFAEPLLEDVPPSIPDDWIPANTPSQAREGFLEELISEEANPAIPDKHTDVVVAEESGEYIETDPAFQPTEIPDYQADTVAQKPAFTVSYEEETVVSKPLEEGKPLEVEPVSPALYNLTYACILLPRFPEHHLTGPLATHLSEWVTQLCLAFGWRLEHLSLRPDYLQWIVNLPPTTSPGYLMRIIRQHTSRRLFVQLPRYEEDNPSGDFWAPGYFILSSNQPPPADLITDFIHQTRKRQGIYQGR